MRLLLHERKSRIYPVAEGIPFLGFRVFPRERRLLPASVKRARRRLTRLADGYASGEVGMDAVGRSVAAWIAHAEHGNTRGLRRRLPGDVVFGTRSAMCSGAALWNNNHDNAACAYRNNNNPHNRNNNIGFCCAKTLLISAGTFGGSGRKAAHLRMAAVCFSNVQTAVRCRTEFSSDEDDCARWRAGVPVGHRAVCRRQR